MKHIIISIVLASAILSTARAQQPFPQMKRLQISQGEVFAYDGPNVKIINKECSKLSPNHFLYEEYEDLGGVLLAAFKVPAIHDSLLISLVPVPVAIRRFIFIMPKRNMLGLYLHWSFTLLPATLFIRQAIPTICLTKDRNLFFRPIPSVKLHSLFIMLD